MKPFRAEWAALEEGENPARYRPLGSLERIVPWVFLAIHLVVIGVIAWGQFVEPAAKAAPVVSYLRTPQESGAVGNSETP